MPLKYKLFVRREDGPSLEMSALFIIEVLYRSQTRDSRNIISLTVTSMISTPTPRRTRDPTHAAERLIVSFPGSALVISSVLLVAVQDSGEQIMGAPAFAPMACLVPSVSFASEASAETEAPGMALSGGR